MSDEQGVRFYNRVYALAQFQAQVSIAALPIGAGVVGFVAQQGYSISMLASLIMVWTGLLIISISIFLNLDVVNFKEPITANERDNFVRASKRAMSLFVAGALLLIASPISFASEKIFASRSPNITISSEVLDVDLGNSHSMEKNIVMTILNVEEDRAKAIKTLVVYTNNNCISVSKENEIMPSSINDAWVKVWRISVRPTCPLGDNVIQFYLLHHGDIIGKSTLMVKIENE